MAVGVGTRRHHVNFCTSVGGETKWQNGAAFERDTHMLSIEETSLNIAFPYQMVTSVNDPSMCTREQHAKKKILISTRSTKDSSARVARGGAGRRTEQANHSHTKTKEQNINRRCDQSHERMRRERNRISCLEWRILLIMILALSIPSNTIALSAQHEATPWARGGRQTPGERLIHASLRMADTEGKVPTPTKTKAKEEMKMTT